MIHSGKVKITIPEVYTISKDSTSAVKLKQIIIQHMNKLKRGSVPLVLNPISVEPLKPKSKDTDYSDSKEKNKE